MKSLEIQLKEIERNTVEITPKEDFIAKLKKSIDTNTPLRVKFGADPSRPDIHFGHSVVLQKLKVLQDLGHEIYFIIGDFTARIGDPTGKSKTRPLLTDEEVVENAKSYTDQVGKILDLGKTKILYNYDWLQSIGPLDMIRLTSKVTVSSLLERDDFSKRFEKHEAIYLHETLYPIMQGYDSVEMKADLEVGGTDQTFNLLMGRHLQKAYDQPPQCILTLPILEGTDGVQKMSKSLDNYISLNESSADMFGKMMSISDELMGRYYDLLSKKSVEEISELKESLQNGSKHPMEAKKELATEIVNHYYPSGTGEQERKKFEERFSKNKIPDDIPEHRVNDASINLLDLMIEVEFIKSKGEGRRLLKQNAVKVDFKTYKEETYQMESAEFILKAGKLRLLKVVKA